MVSIQFWNRLCFILFTTAYFKSSGLNCRIPYYNYWFFFFFWRFMSWFVYITNDIVYLSLLVFERTKKEKSDVFQPVSFTVSRRRRVIYTGTRYNVTLRRPRGPAAVLRFSCRVPTARPRNAVRWRRYASTFRAVPSCKRLF